MSATISCAVWVFRTGAWPSLFKGCLAQEEKEGKILLILSQVKKYTWDDYHGKPIRQDKPKEDVLWRDVEDLVLNEMIQATHHKPGELLFIRESDHMRVIVQPFGSVS